MATLWRNWAGDQRCVPLSIAEPADEAAVQFVVEVHLEAQPGLERDGTGGAPPHLRLTGEHIDRRLVAFVQMRLRASTGRDREQVHAET